MNEYERSECYELLREIIDWDSMLKDNQEEMSQLRDFLRNLRDKQQTKYHQVLNQEIVSDSES